MLTGDAAKTLEAAGQAFMSMFTPAASRRSDKETGAWGSGARRSDKGTGAWGSGARRSDKETGAWGSGARRSDKETGAERSGASRLNKETGAVAEKLVSEQEEHKIKKNDWKPINKP